MNKTLLGRYGNSYNKAQQVANEGEMLDSQRG